ncbi:hypothetical protein N752_26985 [Desulforamulus aquiferis]|nr:hypothetical protein N752_26985 [Desulforamulus aquiferis]
MIHKVPLVELQTRMKRFQEQMDMSYPEWEVAIIVSKVNQYYFTGTMQDGILIILRNGEPTLGTTQLRACPG